MEKSFGIYIYLSKTVINFYHNHLDAQNIIIYNTI